MTADHPFVKWWIEKSRRHQRGDDWMDSLTCAEGVLAIEAWNAAIEFLAKKALEKGYMSDVEASHLYLASRVPKYTDKTASEPTIKAE